MRACERDSQLAEAWPGMHQAQRCGPFDAQRDPEAEELLRTLQGVSEFLSKVTCGPQRCRRFIEQTDQHEIGTLLCCSQCHSELTGHSAASGVVVDELRKTLTYIKRR